MKIVFIWMNTAIDIRSGPPRHGPALLKNRSHFCKANIFLYVFTEWAEISHIGRKRAKLHFFLQKRKKNSSIVFTRFPKNFLGRSFEKKLLRFVYPGYQLHTLFQQRSFTILPLSNMFISNISHFHALYSICIQYLIHFSFYIKFPI